MRKKIFYFLIFFLFLNTAIAENYRIGSEISDRIKFSNKYSFELPKGKWIVADRFSYSYYGLIAKGYDLLKIKNKKATEGFSVAELKLPAKWQGYLNAALHEIVFKNKYDGCYDRPEYYIIEYYAKGSSHNCFWIMHLDVHKELHDPDDPELRGVQSQYKAWLRDNQIKLPKVAIGSSHSYFSRLTGGKWFVIDYYFDPEILGAPKSKFIKEDRSEYHKYNISNYPEHKKIMDQVVSIGAKRHKQFELEVRAKDHHKIDLTQYIKELSTNLEINQTNETLEQLIKLNELYKSGVLDEEEFKKAKGKLLN